MEYKFENYKESADYIKSKLGGFCPKVAMILGSGLGYLGDEVEDAIAVSYCEIPHFKASTAPGHKGRLVFGYLEGKAVAVMPCGSLFKETDAEIRRYFVERGLVEAVVTLPDKLFSLAGITTAIIILSHGNDSVRFVDASDIFLKGRRNNTLRETDISVSPFL